MKKDNINIPLFDYSTKMLIEILDKSNINEKEKEYRKKELLDIYNRMLNDNVIYNKYYDIAHEIKSLEFLSKYPNMLISDDHLHKSGCDFKICNNYNIECVSSLSGNEENNGYYKFRGEGVFNYKIKENIILTRLTQSISSKKNFYDEHIKNKSMNEKDPYIIFLSMGNLVYGAFPGKYGFVLNKILFGVGNVVYTYDRKTNTIRNPEYQYKNEIINHNGSPINCRIFSSDENTCISAILFSHAYIDEHYTKNNTFLFINPFAKNKITVKTFNNIVYWRHCYNKNGKLVYFPKYKGKNLNENLSKTVF